jgi:hypothetical protein
MIIFNLISWTLIFIIESSFLSLFNLIYLNFLKYILYLNFYYLLLIHYLYLFIKEIYDNSLTNLK